MKHTVLDLRGSQNNPERPYRLGCDFCNRSSDRLWCFRTRGFGYMMWPPRGAMESADGAWYACVFCTPLVKTCDPVALFARCSLINEAIRALPESAPSRPQFEGLYRAIFAAIVEDAPILEWRAGDRWPPAWPEVK